MDHIYKSYSLLICPYLGWPWETGPSHWSSIPLAEVISETIPLPLPQTDADIPELGKCVYKIPDLNIAACSQGLTTRAYFSYYAFALPSSRWYQDISMGSLSVA